MSLKVKCVGTKNNKRGTILAYELIACDDKDKKDILAVKPNALKSAIIGNKIEVENIRLKGNKIEIIDDIELERLNTDNNSYDSNCEVGVINGDIEDKGNEDTNNSSIEANTATEIVENIGSTNIVENNEKTEDSTCDVDSNNDKVASEQCCLDIDAMLNGSLEKFEVQAACKEKCIVIEIDSDKHILYLDSNVTDLNEDYSSLTLTKYLQQIHGDLIVVGGTGLNNAFAMFMGCEFRTLDLREFSTSNIQDMRYMFSKSNIDHIYFGNRFDTSNVSNMFSMFNGAKTSSLDISCFNTDKVENMEYMFYASDIQNIELGDINTQNVKSMFNMFKDSKANVDTANMHILDELKNK